MHCVVEGWTPSSFKSSRSDRQSASTTDKKLLTDVTAFMDEEDLKQFSGKEPELVWCGGGGEDYENSPGIHLMRLMGWKGDRPKKGTGTLLLEKYGPKFPDETALGEKSYYGSGIGEEEEDFESYGSFDLYGDGGDFLNSEKSMSQTVMASVELGLELLEFSSPEELDDEEDEEEEMKRLFPFYQPPKVPPDYVPIALGGKSKEVPPPTPPKPVQKKIKTVAEDLLDSETTSGSKVDAGKALLALKGFMPFEANDPEKHSRYIHFLQYSAGLRADPFLRPSNMAMADFLHECDEFVKAAAIFKPLASPIAARFVSSSSNSVQQPQRQSKAGISWPEVESKKEEVKIVEASEIDPSRRTEPSRSRTVWNPGSLLCKRFDVPNPFADDKGSVPDQKPPKQITTTTDLCSIDLSTLLPSSSNKTATAVKQEEDEETVFHSIASKPRPPMELFREIFGDSDEESSAPTSTVPSVDRPKVDLKRPKAIDLW